MLSDMLGMLSECCQDAQICSSDWIIWQILDSGTTPYKTLIKYVKNTDSVGFLEFLSDPQKWPTFCSADHFFEHFHQLFGPPSYGFAYKTPHFTGLTEISRPPARILDLLPFAYFRHIFPTCGTFHDIHDILGISCHCGTYSRYIGTLLIFTTYRDFTVIIAVMDEKRQKCDALRFPNNFWKNISARDAFPVFPVLLCLQYLISNLP